MKLPFLLHEKFELDRKIGQGNFGRVYHGRDLRLNREVAVKILPWESSDPEFLAMFEREAQAMATLNHPNIVTVYDYGECDHGPFMVMEFVDGGNLETLMKKGPMDPGRVRFLAGQISEGMNHAHSQELLHRDLSLNNIMIAKGEHGKDVVKILDFGLVKILGASIQTRGLMGMGTPSYMAPEQINNDELDIRADIFSFGVGLYRMLHGRFPFESEHNAAIAYLIIYEREISLDDSLPGDLKTLIMDCLNKEKEGRPANFKIIADRLEAMDGLEAAPGTPDEGTTVEVVPYLRTSKRNPFLNRVMIKSRRQFVGRKKEVRRIYSRADAPHPQSVSIVGERRIGKSSLLNHIYDKDNRREFMTNWDTSLFAYLDFQRMTDFTVPKFVQFLFGVLELEAGHSLGLDDSCGLDSLRDAVKRIHDEGRRIIVLMDEFEVITRNENFEEEFFSFLRSLANSFRVAYVTSSCDELQQLCHNQDISDSPFFNIFSNLPLRAFSEAEARDLIVGLSEPEGVDLIGYADKVIAMTGCFPFFLQIGACALFEELIDTDFENPDWDRINRAFMDEAKPHFEFFWEHATPEEKINLERIIGGQPTSRKFAFVNESLTRRGYLEKDDKNLRITSSALRKYILERLQQEPQGQNPVLGFLSRFKR